MLYDPKWNQKTQQKTKPSLSGLIAWLEQQNPATAYEWHRIRNCLVCHYLQDAYGYGERPWNELQDKWGMNYADVVGSLNEYHAVGMPLPWTYGAAIKRARIISP